MLNRLIQSILILVLLNSVAIAIGENKWALPLGAGKPVLAYGFVGVALDDQAPPLLGYSTSVNLIDPNPVVHLVENPAVNSVDLPGS